VSVLSVLVGLLPWSTLRLLGAFVGWIAGSLFRVRRAGVLASMRAAGLEEAEVHAAAMYRSLGVSAAEFLWLGAPRNRESLAKHVSIDPQSRELWRACLSRGRGVVIAGSHTGNWDLAACAIHREVPLLVVTTNLRIRWLDRLWHTTRATHGVSRTGARGAMARSRDALRTGGAVAMVIDQVPVSRRHASWVEFLGRPALVDRAPAALAAGCGAPLVAAAARRDAQGDHVLAILGAWVPPAEAVARRAWVENVTVAATHALDEFVRRYPDQWLWLHRRWKRLDHEPRSAMVRGPCTTRS
jgi:KDO2-lipid IV(A) lauroyltransferase